MNTQKSIVVSNLSKKYTIGSKKSASLRDSLVDKLKFKHHNSEEFWAIKNITFEVNQGDVIGIVGKNGAGKSTLLKLLSQITKPTEGRIEINGRVASLLEVGTGFHPELTGRENIFLNGTILGMTRKEVKSKFSEIVAFSGVEKFIDTPVKHYSSGMYVRLAFAVAAHLEPEILIIDEVLAVGDAEFQKKCLGKMKDVSKQGRTVLFVSHNMAAISTLCNKGIFIANGAIVHQGPIDEIIQAYSKYNQEIANSFSVGNGIIDISSHSNKKYNSSYGIQTLKLYCNGKLSNQMFSGCEMKLDFQVIEETVNNNPIVGFVIKDEEGIPVIGINNKHTGHLFKNNSLIEGTLSIVIPSFPLFKEGYYSIDLYWGANEDVYDIILDACVFKLDIADIYNSAHILDKNLNQVIVPNAVFKLENSIQ